MSDDRVHVNLDGLLGTLMRRIHAIIERTAFGLLTASSTLDQPLELPVFVSFSVPEKEKRDINIIAVEYRTWVLTGGFRDCIEALSVFMEELRLVCAICYHGQNGRVESEEWNKGVLGLRKHFHELGLPKKFEFLQSRYQFGIDPEYNKDLRSLNAARNCFVHRQGIVTLIDTKDQAELIVQWRRLAPVIIGLDGESPLSKDRIIQKGESLGIRTLRATKTFALGQSILFTAEEFSEICFTLFLFAQVTTAQLKEYIRSRGIKIRPQDQPVSS